MNTIEYIAQNYQYVIRTSLAYIHAIRWDTVKKRKRYPAGTMTETPHSHRGDESRRSPIWTEFVLFSKLIRVLCRQHSRYPDEYCEHSQYRHVNGLLAKHMLWDLYPLTSHTLCNHSHPHLPWQRKVPTEPSPHWKHALVHRRNTET